MAVHISSPAYLDYVRQNDIKGRVFLLDLASPSNILKEIKLRPSPEFDPGTFKPHGLSILEDKEKGEHLVYIVNHVLEEDDRVEKFIYLPDTNELVHQRSFFSSKFHMINDMVLIKEDMFYVTNFFYFKSSTFISSMESVFRLPLGNVLLFDGTDFIVAAKHQNGPNGVALSKDGKYLYVATSQNKGISVFERFPNNTLYGIQDFYFSATADNLHISQDGKTLFTGTHPITWKILSHMTDPNRLSPSMVLSFPLQDDGRIVEGEMTELFYDHGDLISGSTIGTVFRNKLLIGSLIDKLVLCDLSQSMYQY